MPVKKRSFTIETKLEAIKKVEVERKSIRAVAREYDVQPCRIREWIRKRVDLQAHSVGARKQTRKIGAGRQPMSTQLDEALLEFLDEERAKGRCVRNKDLSQKALALAREMDNIRDNFKASPMFIKRWKKRNNVTMRAGTNTSQKVPADYALQIQNFRTNIVQIRNRKIVNNDDYTKHEIINCDETCVRFEETFSRTNNRAGEKTIRIKDAGASKKAVSVMLAVHANGVKMPAFIIFKEKGGRLGPRVRNALNVPENVIVTATENGWMTHTALCEWLSKVYGEEERERMLVWDANPTHKSRATKDLIAERYNTQLVFVPAGCTPLVQPCDVSLNKPFKDNIREQYRRWMGDEDNRPTTAAGNMRPPSRQDLINWVSVAWEDIDPNIIINSFLLCGIANNVDGSEDKIMFQHVPDVLATLQRQREAAQAEAKAEVDLFEDMDAEVDDIEPFED